MPPPLPNGYAIFRSRHLPLQRLGRGDCNCFRTTKVATKPAHRTLGRNKLDHLTTPNPNPVPTKTLTLYGRRGVSPPMTSGQSAQATSPPKAVRDVDRALGRDELEIVSCPDRGALPRMDWMQSRP